MPRGLYKRRSQREVAQEKIEGKAELSQIRHDAAMSRWQSVQEERDLWLIPFRKLPIERAMRYLEDLRVMCSEAGVILNERINSEKKIRCAGPHCGNDLTGTRPNGMPKWIGKKDFKDPRNPEIWHVLYFCSNGCNEDWTRSQFGVAGDNHGKENPVSAQ